ncbi:MAG: hypothetical protein K0R65_1944 [Crocinitomicaceae bacterium]|jgi:flagellar basal body-associated protein FliL|nr:hypothetical protein [Crocinitomicaceae bacterium]
MRAKRLIPIVLAVLLLAAAWLFWPGKSSRAPEKSKVRIPEKTENQNETQKVASKTAKLSEKENSEIPENKSYTFILKPIQTAAVLFEASGMLENTKTWNPGDRFSKNEVLFQLDNSALFNEISSQKSDLRSRLENLYQQFARETPEAASKWIAYGNAVTETDLLPPLPENISAKERALINTAGIVPLSLQIAQKEQEMFSYFYLAPFNGQVQKVLVPPGNKVKSRQTVALIYPDQTVVLQRKIHRNDLPAFIHQQKFSLKSQRGTKALSVKFSTGKQTGDSVLITAKIPSEKLKLFDFFQTIEISPDH